MLTETTKTSDIREWRSIITLIVFILTNINVLFPFGIPIPLKLEDGIMYSLSALRLVPQRQYRSKKASRYDKNGTTKMLKFPMNFVTAPVIAVLFLLAILAIGRREVHDGTIGVDNIVPIDIMAFFLTLAYIAISIDASGLIRYLAFRVLQWGGDVGHRLFFYLYAFFFSLTCFIGNDPIILSGTAFLAYMTRVSSNIIHPRAWIYTQFFVANIGSAILVSSNPTNLVLAGAFNIKFIHYSANMVVPVIATAIILFPFLLYIIFANEDLIPEKITMHELPPELMNREPVNPNIPNARGLVDEDETGFPSNAEVKQLSLEEIMNPFIDTKGAVCGAVIMAATLIAVLVLNAASTSSGEHPIFYVTLPAAFIMFCWDVCSGWIYREKTRRIASDGRKKAAETRAERLMQEEKVPQPFVQNHSQGSTASHEPSAMSKHHTDDEKQQDAHGGQEKHDTADISNEKWGKGSEKEDTNPPTPKIMVSQTTDDQTFASRLSGVSSRSMTTPTNPHRTLTNEIISVEEESPPQSDPTILPTFSSLDGEIGGRQSSPHSSTEDRGPTTLVHLFKDGFRWLQETFPTATAVVAHLPIALVPFAFGMFILVQALVTKGWVEVFAKGWNHWVNKTETFGAIAGMGFLSVVLCNFAGTNIGTTILLSRVIQAWQHIHIQNGTPISERTFWATVYTMALGVNYGAFSTAFSASLAGLLWRDILAKKHIHVHALDFARVNLPIISISMIVGCSVLAGQIYITRDNSPHKL